MSGQLLLLHLYAETPVHAGGSDARGAVDLPIQREVATELPLVWGQSLKGALKHWLRETGHDALARALLGSEPGENPTTPGRVDVLDAMLVAFPVATLHSTFTWVTSPLVLQRLRRRLAAFGLTALPTVPKLAEDVAAHATLPAGLTRAAFGPHVLVPTVDPQVAGWADWIADSMVPPDTGFADRVRAATVVVDDTVLRSIVTECTEVQARVQLDDHKTARNLFYAEYLPTDTLLSAVAVGPEDDLRRLAELVTGVFWLGGHESVGKGLVWCQPQLKAGDPA